MLTGSLSMATGGDGTNITTWDLPLRFLAPKCEPMKMNASQIFLRCSLGLRAKIVGIPDPAKLVPVTWGFPIDWDLRVSTKRAPLLSWYNYQSDDLWTHGKLSHDQKKNVVILQIYTVYIRIHPHSPNFCNTTHKPTTSNLVTESLVTNQFSGEKNLQLTSITPSLIQVVHPTCSKWRPIFQALARSQAVMAELKDTTLGEPWFAPRGVSRCREK